MLFRVSERRPAAETAPGKASVATVLGLLLGAVAYAGGPAPLLLVFLPTAIVAASTGVWRSYVQHQFEETSWDPDPAALHGSSRYVLPGILRWFTANIGVHHVHDLQSRVPFYRLPEIPPPTG